MIESSKVAFIKKLSKNKIFMMDLQIKMTHFQMMVIIFSLISLLFNLENDSQLDKSDENNSILNLNNKYSRAFLNDLLFYFKHCIHPRFTDMKYIQISKS
jgi:hypothetical protein